MESKRQKTKGKRQNWEWRTKSENPASCSPPPGPWRANFRLWILLALLGGMLLTPITASAQMIGGGWMISLYGLVQVEPGNDVATLQVKDEQIRFAIQNIQCADRNFSAGRFLSDVTHKEPSLYIKGPEEWLDLLINERPSKRVLQMRGVYHPDSRMFLLHKLERFQGTGVPKQ